MLTKSFKRAKAIKDVYSSTDIINLLLNQLKLSTKYVGDLRVKEQNDAAIEIAEKFLNP